MTSAEFSLRGSPRARRKNDIPLRRLASQIPVLIANSQLDKDPSCPAYARHDGHEFEMK